MNEEREQIQRIFEDNVFTFIERDIRREVELARLPGVCVSCGTEPGGGNFMAAMSLLSYTEFMGSFITGTFGRGTGRRNFEAFFDQLGNGYRDFREGIDVYDVYRCGMVHEYTVKQSADIFMTTGDESCGLGRQASGRLYFVVERYLEDFIAAARTLYGTILASSDARRPVKVM
jgi:hypothetical protein